MKTKKLTRKAMLANINGLSKGDRAYCGPYGTITCTDYAEFEFDVFPNCMSSMRKVSSRKFSVSGNKNGVLANHGNYTMKSIRAAICG